MFHLQSSGPVMRLCHVCPCALSFRVIRCRRGVLLHSDSTIGGRGADRPPLSDNAGVMRAKLWSNIRAVGYSEAGPHPPRMTPPLSPTVDPRWIATTPLLAG